MGLTKPKVQSIKGLDALGNIKAAASDLLRVILSLVDNKVAFPMEITVSGKVVTVSASENQVTESDGVGATQNTYKTGVSPLERRYCSFVSSTINVDTGAVTGSFETGGDLTPPPTMTTGQKVYLGFEALSSGVVHILWSEVGTTPDVNTLAWGDDSLKRGFILLTCSTGGTGWGAGRFNNGANTNIVCFGGSGGGGGGGDNSFKLRSITGSTLTLARGALKLSTGDVLVTGSGTLSTTTRIDIAVALASVQNGTATPTDATTYYLYIDKMALGSAITLTDSGERVIRVSAASEFWLATTAPQAMDPRRYIYIGWMRSATTGTSWTGTGSLFGSAAAKLHVIETGSNSDEDSIANYVLNPDFEYDAVGAAPKYVTQGGQAGAGALVTSTGGEVLYGTRSCKLTGGNTGGSLRTWDFDLDTLSGFDSNGFAVLKWTFVARTASTTGVFAAVVYNVTDAIEVPYTQVSIANGDLPYATYFQPVSGKTYKLRFKEVSATTGNVLVDALELQRVDTPYGSGMSKYTSNVTTNSTSLSLNHVLGGEPQMIALAYYNGTNKVPVDPSSVVITKTAAVITLNTNDFDFTGGKYLEVVAYYQASGDNLAVMGSQFRSAWQTSTANTTIAHGLGDIDAIRAYSVIEWDVTNGKRRVVGGLVENFDGTNFTLDWSGFSPSGTLQYQIVAGGGVLPQALPTMLGGYTRYVGFGPGSFATLTAALAASGAGDSILVNGSYSISAAETVSLSNIRIKFMPNVKITVTAGVKGLIIAGSDVTVEDATYEFTAASTTVPAGVEISTGDDVTIERLKVVANATALVITTAVNVLAAADRACVRGRTRALVGTISAKMTDAGVDTYWLIQG
jgi:hypothetical protein